MDEKEKVRTILLDIPDRIETERFVLRIPRVGDGPETFVSVRQSIAELKKWMPWATDAFNGSDEEEWCRKAAEWYITREQIHYFITSREDGRHLGGVGIFKIVWDVPSCEIGYWLNTPQCGKGIMTEAVNTVARLAFETLKAVRVQLLIDEKNEPSIRVAERCGFSLEGTLRNDYRYPDGRLRNTRVYARIAA